MNCPAGRTTVVLTCPAGKVAVGGGFVGSDFPFTSGSQAQLRGSYPGLEPSEWYVDVAWDSYTSQFGSQPAFTANAVCANAA
jgi:hypothetical protein